MESRLRLQCATGRGGQRAHEALELDLEMVIKWIIKIKAALFPLCPFDCEEATNEDVKTSVVPKDSPVCRAWQLSKGIVLLCKQGVKEVRKSECVSGSRDCCVLLFIPAWPLAF